MSKTKSHKVSAPETALTEHEKNTVRNLSIEMPALSLKDLALVSDTLLEAAHNGCVSAYSIGKKFYMSDASADMLLRSLCAAGLMCLHSDGKASLHPGFYKPVAEFHDRIVALDKLEKSRGR